MTKLKDHQAAMVELLAHGSAVAPSTLRLAHAMHDVLAALNGASPAPVAHTERRAEATTSGLNDAALAGDVAFVGRAVKDDRVSELEEENARLRVRIKELENYLQQALVWNNSLGQEQAGCRKDDTQDDGWVKWAGGTCPVPGGTLVDLKMRSGYSPRKVMASAFGKIWEHMASDDGNDIVAYRVVKP